MEWTAIVSVIAAVAPILGFLGYMYIELKEWRKEAREDAAKMERRFEEERCVQTEERRVQTARFEEERHIETARFEEERRVQTARFEEERRVQTARSDQLYQMFIDLLKNQNPKTKP